MADGLMRRWNLDNQCKKAIVILVAIGDKKFWTSRKNGTSIVGTEFTQMFNDQKNLFRSDFQQCAMTIGSNICDPDELLAKEDRQMLNGALEELENVGQGTGSSSCTKKGLTAMLAIADHIDTTGHDAAKKMADGLMRRWNLDNQCKKAIVILVAIGDRKFWTSRKNGTSIVGTEFTQMFNDQKNLFRSGKFVDALDNIIREIRSKLKVVKTD
uniref:VWFA domain-containing protein n=1 Tax=Globodera pallida TaxID=36090 RepID=A0A183CP53_GLOPA